MPNISSLFVVVVVFFIIIIIIIIMLWPQFPPLSREAVDEYKILGDRTKLIFQKIMSKDASNEQSWTRLQDKGISICLEEWRG